MTFKRLNVVTLCMLTIMLAVHIVAMPIPYFFFLALGLVWFVWVALGSFLISWNFHLKSLCRISTDKNVVALTFDDGPHPILTPQVLDLLDQYQMKASFFCIGQQIRKQPDIVRQIVKRGHTLGNHTYTHSPFFDFMGQQRVSEELLQTLQTIREITGLSTPYFRPPYGVTNPRIAKVVKKFGLVSVGWNVRSFDTISSKPGNTIKRVTQRMVAGSIILLHDDRENVVETLEGILVFLQDNGFSSVNLETLIQTNE